MLFIFIQNICYPRGRLVALGKLFLKDYFEYVWLRFRLFAPIHPFWSRKKLAAIFLLRGGLLNFSPQSSSLPRQPKRLEYFMNILFVAWLVTHNSLASFFWLINLIKNLTLKKFHIHKTLTATSTQSGGK